MLPPRRGDLILGMSLAEVVLFLLFCFFVVEVLDREASGGQDPEALIAALREENVQLHERIAGLEKRLGELDRRLKERDLLLEELRRMTGAQGDDLPSFRRAITALKRGFPACAEDNTLVEVIARDGVLRVVVLTTGSKLAAYLADAGLAFQSGQELRSESEIDVFLRRVWSFETRRGEECRFDYRLRYRSASDYHSAREKIERYLYPERIARLDP